jgi:2-keto-4-pentenoate hydratase
MASLAEALWNARATGRVIAVDAAQRPADVAAAYQIQADAIACAGMTRVGWKIGAAAQAAMDLLVLDAPFLAPLLAPHCLADGAEVALVPGQGPGLETEFLVGLGGDLPPRAEPWRDDEVAAAVAFIAPAFEVVASRFEGGLKGNGLLAIADFGGNGAIIQGEPVRDWRKLDLAAHALRLSINDRDTVQGSGGALIYGDPIAMVTWLVNQPQLASCGLRRGEFVMTGTCTGLLALQAGDAATADFGALGKVHAAFK